MTGRGAVTMPGAARTLVRIISVASLVFGLRGVAVAQPNDPQNLTGVGDTLFFTATSDETGRELWKSDGTPEGTTLVADIAPGDYSSEARNLVDFRGMLYFTAGDSSLTRQLWRSDGTQIGTGPLRPLVAGPSFGSVAEPTAVGETLFFTAYDNGTGQEVWKTDGTPGGTVLVRDIQPGGSSSEPTSLTAANGLLFFTAEDDLAERWLWRSGGTEESTFRLENVPMIYSYSLSTALGLLFFAPEDPQHGSEPWRSDGSADGTFLLEDIFPGHGSSDPDRFASAGPFAYFVAGGELWRSDGTPAGTMCLCDLPLSGDSFAAAGALGDDLLFFADGNDREPALWKIEAATGAVSKIVQTGFLNDAHAIVHEGRLFFSADNGATGSELWVSDGTPEGSHLVADIVPGPTGSAPSDFVSAGGHLFFSALDPITGRRSLWTTNGDASGVRRLSRTPPAPPNDECAGAVQIGMLPFTHQTDARSATGNDTDPAPACAIYGGRTVWYEIQPAEFAWVHAAVEFVDSVRASLSVYQGSCEALQPVPDTCASPEVSGVTFRVVPGQRYFILANAPAQGHGQVAVSVSAVSRPSFEPFSDVTMFPANGLLFLDVGRGLNSQIWVTDGSVDGSTPIGPESFAASEPLAFALHAGSVFFGNPLRGLVRSDGTPQGTLRLANGLPDYEPHFTSAGLFLFFAGYRPHTSGLPNVGLELWRSDGTDAGTVLVKDIAEGERSSEPDWLVDLGGTLLFTADSGNGRELWRSDGTEAGTRVVAPGKFTYPINLSRVGNAVFFSAGDDAGYELWRTDGSDDGTHRVADIAAGTNSSFPGESSDLNGTAFFSANDRVSGYELWRSDGTAEGTRLVRDIAAGPMDSSPLYFSVVGGGLFFSAFDGPHGVELWRTDGKEEGTVLLGDLAPGSAGSSPRYITDLGGVALFSAGYALWRSDGTGPGTKVVRRSFMGYPTTFPEDLTRFGDEIVFIVGDHLWRSDGTAGGTVPLFPGKTARNANCDGRLSAADVTAIVRASAVPLTASSCIAADAFRGRALAPAAVADVIRGVFGAL